MTKQMKSVSTFCYDELTEQWGEEFGPMISVKRVEKNGEPIKLGVTWQESYFNGATVEQAETFVAYLQKAIETAKNHPINGARLSTWY